MTAAAYLVQRLLAAAYRIALLSFPRDFRRRFGIQMSETFDSYCAPSPNSIVRLARGMRGVLEAARHGVSERFARAFGRNHGRTTDASHAGHVL